MDGNGKEETGRASKGKYFRSNAKKYRRFPILPETAHTPVLEPRGTHLKAARIEAFHVDLMIHAVASTGTDGSDYPLKVQRIRPPNKHVSRDDEADGDSSFVYLSFPFQTPVYYSLP